MSPPAEAPTRDAILGGKCKSKGELVSRVDRSCVPSRWGYVEPPLMSCPVSGDEAVTLTELDAPTSGSEQVSLACRLDAFETAFT